MEHGGDLVIGSGDGPVGCSSPIGRITEAHEERHGLLHGFRISSGETARGVDPSEEIRQLSGVVVEIAEPGVPRRNVGKSDRQHPGSVRPDHQRRPSHPTRAGEQHASIDAVELAVVAHLLTREESADDVEALLEAGNPPVERDAEGVELGPVPSGADPDHEPALADLVDGGGHLGEHRRFVEG